MVENQDLISQANLTVGAPFDIDVNKLFESQIFFEDWSEFRNDLQDNPSHTLNCLGLAVHQVLIKRIIFSLPIFFFNFLFLCIIFQTIVNTLKINGSDNPEDVPMIRVRIVNYLPIIPLKDLRVNYYGMLIFIN